MWIFLLTIFPAFTNSLPHKQIKTPSCINMHIQGHRTIYAIYSRPQNTKLSSYYTCNYNHNEQNLSLNTDSFLILISLKQSVWVVAENKVWWEKGSRMDAVCVLLPLLAMELFYSITISSLLPGLGCVFVCGFLGWEQALVVIKESLAQLWRCKGASLNRV